MFGGEAFGEYTFSDAFSSTNASLLGLGTLSVSREFRIFSATSEFTTLPTDSLASTPFFGTLAQPLSFTRSLLGSDIIGNFSSGTGELDIDNTDGEYDFLIQDFAIDGRAIVVKVGREGDSYDKFYTVFNGTASDWIVAEDKVKIQLVDKAYLLNVPAQPNNYGGAGGIDGGTDLKGKRKPRCFGSCLNISPPLVIPSSLVYQVNDGPIQGIVAVYDRGASLTFQTDYATSALLIAASVTSGNYSTCSAEGFFKLGSSPSGTITSDVNGDKSFGLWSRTASQIIVTLLETSTTVASYYLPFVTAMATLSPAIIGYYIAPDDTNTIADVVSNIMGSVGGWGGFRRSGQFELGIFLTPVGATPNAIFDRSDIIQISREALPSTLTPPPYRFRCSYNHNWTVQTDLAGSVPASRVAFLAQSDRYSDSIDLTVKLDHPFAADRDPIPSYFTSLADAQTESDRLLALYRKSAALYRFTVGIQPFALDLGDVVNLTYPRWDLTVGKNLRVVEMTENAQTNTIEVVGYG